MDGSPTNEQDQRKSGRSLGVSLGLSGVKGVIGISGAIDIPIAAIDDITHRYQARGLEGFTVVTSGETVSVS